MANETPKATVVAHPATINARDHQKSIRAAARISRIHQAIAQKGHSCPVEDLHAEIAVLHEHLDKMGHPKPTSHQEAAELWLSLEPNNPHAHHQAAHDEHGNQSKPDYPGLHVITQHLQGQRGN